MSENLYFWVSGTPAPGGSKTAYPIYRNGKLVMKGGRPIIRVVDAGGKRNKNWRACVADAAKTYFEALGMEPLRGALSLHCVFYMPRIQAHFRAKQQIRPDAPKYHIVKPDATKLLRSTEDALTGIAWVDDAQIIHQIADKVYADPNKREKTGCAVWISQLP